MIPREFQQSIAAVQQAIGHEFREPLLLLEALTHKSFHHENRKLAGAYNERLEFLGDSVIGLIIVESLFLHEKKYDESILAKLKSYLVSEPVFAKLALSLGLGEALLLGKGESSTGGRRKPSILANVFESVVGAVYLDAGFDRAKEIVLGMFLPIIGRSIKENAFSDSKTELQERTQAEFGCLPEYRVITEQGVEHERVFTVAVYLSGKKLATASGKRKKEAEALAAKKALLKMEKK
ncbi:MAG: hypothetical protein OHK006_08390 [Thermodesulfovibrionales bacterium]